MSFRLAGGQSALTKIAVIVRPTNCRVQNQDAKLDSCSQFKLTDLNILFSRYLTQCYTHFPQPRHELRATHKVHKEYDRVWEGGLTGTVHSPKMWVQSTIIYITIL